MFSKTWPDISFKQLINYRSYNSLSFSWKLKMETQVPLFREKRQFGRVRIGEVTICQVHLPLSRELRGYRGIIQNISLGGLYFVCDEGLSIKKGDPRNFLFDIVYKYQKIYRLKLHALIVRNENLGTQYGVALKFLSDPIYYPHKQIDDNELHFLDKTRIMYQNYDLYRKAYELIKMTPDIRIQRIDHIKKRLHHNLYKIDQIKLAQSMIVNLSNNFN